jgi:3,4-dihydroxy 2-butanone 4-phosphate synthase/GTP cyclohydrolase II
MTTTRPLFTPIAQALEDIRQGKIVIIADDERRENEGDFMIAADKVTPEAINFLTRYGRGLVCMPMAKSIADRLGLSMMVQHNTSKHNTPFTVSIGARHGVTTGISAADRAHTVKVAAHPDSTPADLTMPGHIFPLVANEYGVLARTGHTEACVDLARLAGLSPAAVLCEVLNEDGTMARRDDLRKVAQQHGLSMITIADLIQYRLQNEVLVTESASATLPLKNLGDAEIKIYETPFEVGSNIALLFGDIKPGQTYLVRVHSQCVTGDVFGSARCDCGEQLDLSLKKLREQGGILLYMNQEGRGIGLANKIKAYALQQQQGLDTVETNFALNFPADLRNYGVAAQILKHLGITSIRLLTNNPKKITGLEEYGIKIIAREPIETTPNDHNINYLRTKYSKLGHLFSSLD